MGTMKQFLESQKQPRVPRDSRHIRWNCEQTPGDPELKRLHLVVVDDKDINRYRDKVLEQLRNVGSVDPVRIEIEGRVKGSKRHYMFCSYDTNVDPAVHVNWANLGRQTVRDAGLMERTGSGRIEAYVDQKYAE